MEVKFKKLYEDVEIPQYGTEHSAGFDLVLHNFKKLLDAGSPCNDPSVKDVTDNITGRLYFSPNSRVLVGCGYAVAIPQMTQLEVRARSGNALKLGLAVLNGPGTIDADYRGEVGAILHNSSPYGIVLEKGMRVAQAVLMPYFKASFIVVNELSETERGVGGYGSTDPINMVFGPLPKIEGTDY